MEGIHQGTATAFHQGKRTTKLPQENVLSSHIFPGQKSYNILLELTTQKTRLQFFPFLQPSHPHELGLAPTPSSARWLCVLCIHSSKGRPNCSRQNDPLGGRHKAVFWWHEFQVYRGFGHECVQTLPEKTAMTTSAVSAPQFCLCFGLCYPITVSSQAYVKGWQVLSLSSAGTTNLRQVKEVITCISLCTLTDSLSVLLHVKAAFLPHPCCPLCSWWHRRPASPDLQNSFRALIIILYCRVMAESLKGT